MLKYAALVKDMSNCVRLIYPLLVTNLCFWTAEIASLLLYTPRMVKDLSLREKATFSNFVLCQVGVEGIISLPGVKGYKQEGGFVEWSKRKREFEIWVGRKMKDILYPSLAQILKFPFLIFIVDAFCLHLPAGFCTGKTAKTRRLIPMGQSQNVRVIKLQSL